jgi:hypothetical protein
VDADEERVNRPPGEAVGQKARSGSREAWHGETPTRDG